VKIFPKGRLGLSSVIIMVCNLVLFLVGSLIPWKPSYSGFEIVTHNPLQAIITILMLVAGITTAIIGISSVIKEKERAVLVYLAILFGIYNIIGFFGVVANLFLG